MTNRVVFSYPVQGVRVSATMIPPKRYTDINAWFNVGMKAVRRVGGFGTNYVWQIDEEIVSPDTIVLKLTDKDGHLSSLTIERRGTMSKVR